MISTTTASGLQLGGAPAAAPLDAIRRRRRRIAAALCTVLAVTLAPGCASDGGGKSRAIAEAEADRARAEADKARAEADRARAEAEKARIQHEGEAASETASPRAGTGPPTSATRPSPGFAAPGHGYFPVLAVDGRTNVATWDGPSTVVFRQRKMINAGTHVRLVCTAYGQPVTANGGTSRLWNYTDVGWISDQLLETGIATPAAPACTSTTINARVGTAYPRRDLGPFPVIATDLGGFVSLYRSPWQSSPVTIVVDDTTLVTLKCAAQMDRKITPPPRLAPYGGNAQWDYVQLGNYQGWVPDSYISSYTSGSAAPPCPPF